MFRGLYFFLEKWFFSFPVQLLFNNFRRNIHLLLCWVIMFAMITGSFGKYMGIPYLFLDPEYLNKVNFRSFFIMGVVTSGFIIAFQITCYIIDGHRFSFVGALSTPFKRFALNNSIIPVLFLGTYVYQIIKFQQDNEYSNTDEIILNLTGLFTGFVAMTLIFIIYFRFTNKDIFKYVVCRIDEKIKSNVGITRASAMNKLEIARKKQVRVDHYLDFRLRLQKVENHTFYNRETILQVFSQNHLNLVIIELLIFILIVVLGIFKDNPSFQLPAAASVMIFLTVLIMLAGAFSYWFGGWSAMVGLVVFIGLNQLVADDFFTRRYEAFGLDYQQQPAAYSVKSLQAISDSATLNSDRERTLGMLENWRAKFPGKNPKMVFICSSGGGKRAALWTFTALQAADSLTAGQLMNHSILITGASGGLIGASFFRELTLQKKLRKAYNPYAYHYRTQIASDNLNPLIFSLLANDLFVGFSTFEYAGNLYYKDRSYTFEQQVNLITDGILDKPISAYDSVEQKALVPMIILTPTIVNDGRKLYIASRPVSFMNSDVGIADGYGARKIGGVDFNRLFADQGGSHLRFLSALRMSATFPYITPNTTLPTDPPIEIMDAGISDNFGISDAIRFIHAYKDWIHNNTSGIVILSIRDSPKLGAIPPRTGASLVDALTQPISSVYNNFENFQDISADLGVSLLESWMPGHIQRIDLEYQSESYVGMLQGMDSIRQNNHRASLSWRLTTREKVGIINALNTDHNQQSFEKLRILLNEGN